MSSGALGEAPAVDFTRMRRRAAGRGRARAMATNGFDAVVLVGPSNQEYAGIRQPPNDAMRMHHEPVVVIVTAGGDAPFVWTGFPEGVPDDVPAEQVHGPLPLEYPEGVQALTASVRDVAPGAGALALRRDDVADDRHAPRPAPRRRAGRRHDGDGHGPHDQDARRGRVLSVTGAHQRGRDVRRRSRASGRACGRTSSRRCSCATCSSTARRAASSTPSGTSRPCRSPRARAPPTTTSASRWRATTASCAKASSSCVTPASRGSATTPTSARPGSAASTRAHARAAGVLRRDGAR